MAKKKKKYTVTADYGFDMIEKEFTTKKAASAWAGKMSTKRKKKPLGWY